MKTVADVALSDEDKARCNNAYRLVGKREAGWEYKPELIPLYIIMPLLGQCAAYLKETGESKETIDGYADLMILLDDVA